MSTISAGTTSTTTLIHSGDTTGSLVLKTNDTGSGGTTAVTINTSQNVGIGTSSPAVKLEVKASSGAGEIRVDSSAGDILQLQSSATESRIGSISAVPLTFRTSNVEAMRIDSSGNVQVGTTGNPAAAKFFVAGTSAFGTAGAPEGQLTIDGTNAYLDARLTGGGLIFRTNGSSERMRIDSSGNVGIGNTTVRNKLDVVGNTGIYSTGATSVGSPLGAQVYIGDSNYNTTSYYNAAPGFGAVYDATYASAAALAFYTYAGTPNARSERMRIDSSGNVGIGTASPLSTSQLTVASKSLSVTGADANFNAGGARTFVDLSGTLGRVGALDGGAASATSLAFFTGGGSSTNNERMRIDSSGNVGIGTASPSYKFHVVGNDLLLTTSSGNTVFGTTTTASGVTVTGGIQALQAQSLRVGTFGGSGAYNVEFVSQNNVRVVMAASGNFYPATDNAYSCGISGGRWSAVWAANGTIQTSDINAKIDVVDSPLGLSFIASLRPVAYKYKVGRNQVIDNPEDTDNPTIIPIAGKRQHFGLIAQEVKAALPDGIDFGGWALTDFEDQNSEQGLRYDQFIAPMIKAIQEQQALIQQLQADVAALKGV